MQVHDNYTRQKTFFVIFWLIGLGVPRVTTF